MWKCFQILMEILICLGIIIVIIVMMLSGSVLWRATKLPQFIEYYWETTPDWTNSNWFSLFFCAFQVFWISPHPNSGFIYTSLWQYCKFYCNISKNNSEQTLYIANEFRWSYFVSFLSLRSNLLASFLPHSLYKKHKGQMT